MVKAKIKGVNTTRKRLADGSIKVYYWHRDSGTAVPGKPGDAAFLVAFIEADAVLPKDVGNVNALIRDYLMGLTFDMKRDSTKREYKRMLMLTRERSGKLPIKALESPRVRGVFLDYLRIAGTAEDAGRYAASRPLHSDPRR